MHSMRSKMQAMSDMQTINNRVVYDTVYIAFFVDSGFGLIEKVRFWGCRLAG